jgi:glutamate dehydrogenase
MSVDATDQRIKAEDLLEAAKNFEGFKLKGKLDPMAVAFLTQIADDATIDDVGNLSFTDLAHLAHNFWCWSAQKRQNIKEIRLYDAKGPNGKPLGRDILEICGPDSSFLVDSVMAEIGAQGIEVRAMFHPLVEVSRDDEGKRSAAGLSIKESMIQVHLPDLPPSKRETVLEGVRETLEDVRLAVGDFHAIKARMVECIRDLSVAKTKSSNDEIMEAVSFLKWIEGDKFVFLGARSYEYSRNPDGSIANDEPDIIEEDNLGILRNQELSVLRRANEPTLLSDKLLAFLEEASPIVVAKSNLRSRVHRRSVMDYIGIKRYDENGYVYGEDRFIGLFTAEAYDRMVRDVPLLRRKVERVVAQTGFVANSHNDKRFRNIVENYPRDELFQIDEEDLLRIALGVQHLMDRPRTRIFVRRDRFDRFLSILVFVPRDKYNTDIRAKIGTVLATSYGGRLSAYYPLFGDAPLARVHYIIGLNPNDHLEPNVEELEHRIAELTRTWDDAVEVIGEESKIDVSNFLGRFPAGYKDVFTPAEAIKDIVELAEIGEDGVNVRAYRNEGDSDFTLRCKLYKTHEPVALSEAMPIFQSMGLYVESETQYPIKCNKTTYWVHDVEMRTNDSKPLNYSAVDTSFEDAFSAIWAGLAENDGFNQLILKLGISWREASLIRAWARWRGQTGLDPSQTVQEQALADYPKIAGLLLELFNARFGLEANSKRERDAKCNDINKKINDELNSVPSLDADRVLRRLLGLINNMVRTNYFQTDSDGNNKPYMSFKIATSQIAEVPNPKPFREIWVWSPLVEGAHLRFGPIARGGLRWSDRRDDFRTEVLGLVKAQQVKNAVIVPVGSKGAFFPKRLPKDGSRDEIQAKAIEAYKVFLCGLLDLTDNINPQGEIVPPKMVVRHDGDDPYLVVAADKGTATFSDIANGLSKDYGHWLGDAFASGGSVGYDHKKMAITAKGAWEAVKRHFREIGKDIQTEDFSVIGIGDMSGDVFGNGMLLSKKIKLIAAFDHRDIFIDPNPNPETSFKERHRMFGLARSSWADYNKDLISQGGGIFSRSLKSIPLSSQMKELTSLEADEVTPFELMNALLKAKCELLWFGGIGTYVKSNRESHADAGDKANDPIRINGEDIRASVIGEGANLGLTQLGRIEAARNGVRLNTDAIDNSAGVDSSDHEVNIKILLNGLVRQGAMSEADRDKLLASMTDDVARHVLAHNYDQTLAISLQHATATHDLDAHERLMDRLTSLGHLDRKIEFLPSSEEMRARIERSEGLTRPELSVLTAYGKIQLYGEIIASGVAADPWLERILFAYFPDGCQEYKSSMLGHRLKAEIISTVLANNIVDLGGVTFMDRARESAMADTKAIVSSYVAAREIFELDRIVKTINTLDLKASSDLQIQLMADVIAVLRRQTYWLARRSGRSSAAIDNISDLINAYKNEVTQLKPQILDILSPFERERLKSHAQTLVEGGAPKDLAKEVSALRILISSTDIIDIAKAQEWPIIATARIYHGVGEYLGFDELRYAANLTSTPDHWDRVAIRRLIEDFMGEQSSMTASIIDFVKNSDGKAKNGAENSNRAWAEAAIKSWLHLNSQEAVRAKSAIDELKNSGGWTFAKLSIANTQLKSFTNLALSNEY